MSSIHTIRAHAQEVWDKLNKDWGSCQSGSKVVTHDSKSDLPLGRWKKELEGHKKDDFLVG